MLSFLILFASFEAFGRVPDSDAARELVEQAVETILNEEVRARWVEDSFVIRDNDGQFSAVTPELAVSLLDSARYGGNLYNGVARSEVVECVVSGPDYVRVVLSGESRFSFVVVMFEGRLQIVDWGFTQCGQCSEPARFLTDLVQSVVSNASGIYRLLPGVELIRSESQRDSARYPQWVRAMHARNVTGGYTRSVLSGARIIGSSGNNVHVELSSGREVWPVDFHNGRWVILYDDLETESMLRLNHSDVAAFSNSSSVAEIRAELWEPVILEQGNQIILDRDSLYVAPRNIYSDIVVYGQDIGRRWAQVSLVEERGLSPILVSTAPTISSRLKVDISGWTNEFNFALSPDERHLLLGAYNLAWIIDLESGEVVWEARDFRSISSLTWSGDGSEFAIGECRNFSNDEARRSPSESVDGCINGHIYNYSFNDSVGALGFSMRIPGHRPALLAYDGGSLWSVADNAGVILLSLGEQSIGESVEQPDCNQYESGRYQPALRQLLFSCLATGPDSHSVVSRSLVTLDLTSNSLLHTEMEPIGLNERIISVSPSGRSVLVTNGELSEVHRLADGERFQVAETGVYNPQWSDDELDIFAVDPVGNGSRWRLLSP